MEEGELISGCILLVYRLNVGLTVYVYGLRFEHHFDYPFIKNLWNILGVMVQQLFHKVREKLDK